MTRTTEQPELLFPDAVLHWFERCGHFPQWDAPRKATQLILESTD